MCIEWPWEATKAGLTFGQMANVQTVGLGLYLALAVIQAVSTTGVAGLTRRVATLRQAVVSGNMGPVEIGNAKRLSYDVSGLEIGFHDLNRRLLAVVFALFSTSLAYFAYTTAYQNLDAGQDGVWFIFFIYLVLPVLIFMGSSILISWRCQAVAKKVGEAEKRVTAKTLGLKVKGVPNDRQL
ncbi:hypothetical protein C8J46_105315 [Sphingomonas sp. PP-F2F-A104-K0414]|uniref:hypothetical protein n=1 Tax=Sphingomonas sp. PP-F2F-A104-K0414 TaxID=2135661 RepID=UPI001048339C|nr:hypothetical protein [Sphingomonas sp. PP-F2F-A104-K0414]TCP98162.1 hypothetical protein C8J46_105315 [Sphingomonas sp. PP-F2F-A104-K0414]